VIMTNYLNQKGQALLIVVLAMVVALTVGLAVVSRSITNLRNSQQEVGSQQALSAAEAGVEQAIKSGTDISSTFLSAQTSYQTSVQTVSGAAKFLLNGNNKVSQDDSMYIWLTPYSSDNAKLFQDSNRWNGNINIYWGDSATACNNAALEIAVLYGSRATPLISRSVYDPCSARKTVNSFSQPNSVNYVIANITLYNQVSIPVTNGFLVRVTPLYADAYIGAVSSDTVNRPLPSQGSIIISTGTTGTGVERKLNVFQGYPEVPAELFPFTIFWP
jgi:Tfp pilus assembly protein PilX